jgi:predicted PurR-regulated permease PerM
MMRGRLHRIRRRGGGEGETEAEFIELDPAELSGIFTVPQWLRDIGLMAWLLVGVALFLVGAVWLASLTSVIVIPVIVAAVVAAVASPIVGWLARHRIPRFIGAVLVLLGIIAIGVGTFVVVLAGITSELGSISSHLSDAKDTIAGWLTDVGVDTSTATEAKNAADHGVSESFSALMDGVGSALNTLSSLVFFLAMTTLSLLFLLADGPKIRSWAEGHLGVPLPVARVVSQRTLGALRGYFVGVAIVAGFNALVVTAGALILDVPLVGTIAVVTFFGGFVPYLGAWTAGAFSVLLALGGSGVEAAGGMIFVQLLANSVLQQLVQPFAMGAALGIHPLAVLIVTIAGGALFGAIGLILAAPLVSAIVRISADLARARAEEEGPPTEGAPPPADAAAASAPP